ncbi:zinc finger SWIM domain-containing protein 3-like, partial [Aphis craccivora]
MKQNCPAFIYVRITSDGMKLEIPKMDKTHNHETSALLFSNLPNQRHLAPQMKEEILELMNMKANKKLIQSKIHTETGKMVTSRDLSNIRSTEIKKRGVKTFEETVEDVKKLYHCNVELLTDHEGNFLGMFIQDSKNIIRKITLDSDMLSTSLVGETIDQPDEYPFNSGTDIKLPIKVKCCAPKGATKTTIGLQIKRKLVKPVPFVLLNYLIKENLVMEWLTNKAVVKRGRKEKYIIQEGDVQDPENVSNGIVENEVDIGSIKPYCSKKPWRAVISLMKIKKEHHLDMPNVQLRDKRTTIYFVRLLLEMTTESTKKKSNNYCSVFGCCSFYSTNEDISFHCLPKINDPKVLLKNKWGQEELVDRRRMWAILLRFSKEALLKKHILVCSKHFTSEDFLP